MNIPKKLQIDEINTLVRKAKIKKKEHKSLRFGQAFVNEYCSVHGDAIHSTLFYEVDDGKAIKMIYEDFMDVS